MRLASMHAQCPPTFMNWVVLSAVDAPLLEGLLVTAGADSVAAFGLVL